MLYRNHRVREGAAVPRQNVLENKKGGQSRHNYDRITTCL